MTRRGRSGGSHGGGGARVGLIALLATFVLAACSATVDVETTAVQPLTPASTAPVSTHPSRAPATAPSPDAPSAPSVPVTTAPGSTIAFQAGADRPPQAYDASLSAAIEDLRAFWTLTFPTVYGRAYTDLQGGIWAVYPGATGVPGCGAAQTAYADIQGNAFYCPQGDFMAFDDHELFPQISEQYGADVVDMIVAHEWGHAIQARARVNDLPTIQLEQQADCFAGAWMGHLATETNGPFVVNDDSLNIAFAGMVSFSDAPGTTADVEGAHGSGFDRVSAFQDGFSGGASQCATYATNPPTVIELPFTNGDVQSGGNMAFADVVPTTVADLDRFWAKVFAARSATYAAPAGGLKPYPAAGPYPSCPDVPSAASFYKGRVWYCPTGDFIGYDQDALSGRVYSIGDFAVSVLVGNAWAEAMQDRLGITTTGKDRSLASDCLTGAWTRSTLPSPNGDDDRKLTLSAGDLDEGIIAFLRFGDGQNGGRADQVTTVFDRVASFRKGILQGISACGIG